MRGEAVFLSALLITSVLAGCESRRSGASGGSSTTDRIPDAVSDRHTPALAGGEAALGLTRALPRAYREVCSMQAAMAPAGARRCPPLIPEGPLKVVYRGKSLGRDGPEGGFSADLESRSLNKLDGTRVVTNGGHWRYDVVWTPRMRRVVIGTGIRRPLNAHEPSSCHATHVAARQMLACTVVPYKRGGGLNGGHIAYVWETGFIAYVISLHGYPNEHRLRLMMAALVAAVDV